MERQRRLEKKNEEENMGRMESRGPERVLGGSGVSNSYVLRVRTPANLPHFYLRFAEEIVSKPTRGPIQDGIGWFP